MKKELSLAEVKKIEIEILDYIVSVCEANNLRYFLAGGTLLGAVRHGGFIPWDDDIDINMPRPDYDKLVEIMRNVNGRFMLKAFEISEDYVYAFAKMVDTTTELIEKDIPHPGYGLFVDIFPLDGLPNDESERKRFQDKLWKYNNMLGYSIQKSAAHKNLIFKIKYIFSKCIGYKRLLKLIGRNAKSYLYELCDYVAVVTTAVNKYRKIPRELYEGSTYLSFEGKEYSVPEKYDEYLTGLYGDYMKLPPEDKRISNHNFAAYKFEE